MTRLEDIKARLAAACPGPWTGVIINRPYGDRCVAIVRKHADGEPAPIGPVAATEAGTSVTLAVTMITSLSDYDTMIAMLHFRDDIEYLVAEVEKLREILGDIVAGEPGAVKLASRYLALPEAP